MNITNIYIYIERERERQRESGQDWPRVHKGPLENALFLWQQVLGRAELLFATQFILASIIGAQRRPAAWYPLFS